MVRSEDLIKRVLIYCSNLAEAYTTDDDKVVIFKDNTVRRSNPLPDICDYNMYYQIWSVVVLGK